MFLIYTIWTWCVLLLRHHSTKEPPSSWPKAVALHERQKSVVCPLNDAVACMLCVRLPFTMLPRPAKVSEPPRGLFSQGTAQFDPCFIVSRVHPRPARHPQGDSRCQPRCQRIWLRAFGASVCNQAVPTAIVSPR